jgi:hypothetical protein
MLTLDGGGILGVMSLEILAELENQLAKATGEGADFRLGKHFDYIAGTSTGAIIAAGLAIGMSVKELINFYVESGPAMFDRAAIWQRLRTGFDDKKLRQMLQQVMGTRTLGAVDLKCLLTIVTRNATSDSPWPVSNNPFAHYNDPTRKDCNLQIPLWQLVRASTAAPTYFPPEVLQWDKDDPAKTFTFVDGGTTPYKISAFLLFRMATAPEYRLGWSRGEKNLMLVSVGTGSSPRAESSVRDHGRFLLTDGIGLIGVLMGAANVDQDINCRTVGRCVFGLPIDSELGDMIPRTGDPLTGSAIPLNADQGRAFLYARYDPDVTKDGLVALGLPTMDPACLQKMEETKFIPQMQEVGRAFAKKHVRISDFGDRLQ